MTRVARSRLLTPLVYLAALVLLLEEWCWDAGMRLAVALSRWPWLQMMEWHVRRLPPWAALCAFVLPGLLLLPVKLLAVVAIAHGHALSGITTLVVAKIGGAAVVARLYTLTLPTLLDVRWFARGHGGFMALKTRCFARLRESAAVHRARALLDALRRTLRHGRRRLARGLRLRRGVPFGSRRASRAARVLRRFVVLWRARRR
jgi:hypothetical protein